MTYGDLLYRVQAEHLTIFGTLLGARGTILLLGPHEPGFWPALCDSPEWRDGAADPVDRWSRRVITGLADGLARRCIFLLEPSQLRFSLGPWPVTAPGSAPSACWCRPKRGLWSPIAALWNLIGKSKRLKRQHSPAPDAPSLAHRLPSWRATGRQYDVEACRSYVQVGSMTTLPHDGCLARRACPVSQTYERDAAQSAYHMREFLN